MDTTVVKTLPEEIYPVIKDTSAVNKYNDIRFSKSIASRVQELKVFCESSLIAENISDTAYMASLKSFIDVGMENFAIPEIHRNTLSGLWRKSYLEDIKNVAYIFDLLNKALGLKQITESERTDKIRTKIEALQAISGILKELTPQEIAIFDNEVKRRHFFK